MSAVWGYLVVAGLGIIAAVVSWFGGGRSERLKAGKAKAEKQRDRALEVEDVDEQLQADRDRIESIPDARERLRAASQAAKDAAQRYKRRRSD